MSAQFPFFGQLRIVGAGCMGLASPISVGVGVNIIVVVRRELIVSLRVEFKTFYL